MNQIVKTIGTHSGQFHMDEVLGALILTKYTKDYKDAQITRTRDMKILDTLDLILDVGSVYDAEKLRFDHHQKEFMDVFSDKHKVRMSSAGLIYKHFGREAIKNIVDEILKHYEVKLEVDDDGIEAIYLRIYDRFILYVDAVDNGVPQLPKDVQPVFMINSGLAERIGRLNPAGYEKAEPDVRFRDAMKVADEELREQTREAVLGWYRSRRIVEEAFLDRKKVHESGAIFHLRDACAWKSHIYDLEKKHNAVGQVIYALVYDDKSDEYRIQCVSEHASSFVNRKSLPKEWQGFRNEELQKVSNVSDAVFCHANGFIGGAKSYEGVLKMAT